jgi:hypothetical protein
LNKIQLAFLKSHIKWAIYELECANKMKPNCVDVNLIIELKVVLEKLENEE